MSDGRTLIDDLKTTISNYKVRRDNCNVDIEKLLVKRDEFTQRIMELENLLDKHEAHHD